MKHLILPALAGLLLITGCTGGDKPEVVFLGVEPCLAKAGQTVTAIWGVRQDSDEVDFGGAKLPMIPVDSSRTKFTFKIPDSTVDGIYRVALQEDITVANPTTIIEGEPNEATNGADATNVGKNRSASGELSAVTDKDHFNFDCMLPTTYEITVSPRVVGQVYVDGTAVSLDAFGKGRFVPTRDSVLIGLTGAMGVYTITLGLPSS